MKRRRVKVEDLMSTALIVLKESDSLDDAKFEMSGAAIRHLPVVDHRNHVVGIVSSRDMLRAPARREGTRIGQIMSRAVRTVRPDTPAHEAVAMMIEHKIGSLPVVGEDEQVVGIVTETDFLAVAHEALRRAEHGIAEEV